MASTSDTDDHALLQRWQAGDNAAGDILFRRHFSSIYRFFSNKLPDRVDDLVQGTFTGCVRSRDRIDGRRSFRAYLLGIAKNQLLMELRRMQRKEVPIDLDRGTSAHLSQGASAVLAAREEERAILLGLRRLPLRQQMLLELHYWEDLPVGETAELLGVPAGTIKSRLSRARKKLREEIENARLDARLVESTLGGFESWLEGLKGSD